MKTSESISNLTKALATVQPLLAHPKHNSTNPHLKNKFADLGAVIDANREVLAKHGLAVVQTMGGRVGVFSEAPVQIVSVTTALVHGESGEFVSEYAEAIVKEMKGLNLPQQMGVTYTYLRRYGWQTILGLYGEADTDGATGKENGKPAAVSSKNQQAQELMLDFEQGDIDAVKGHFATIKKKHGRDSADRVLECKSVSDLEKLVASCDMDIENPENLVDEQAVGG